MNPRRPIVLTATLAGVLALAACSSRVAGPEVAAPRTPAAAATTAPSTTPIARTAPPSTATMPPGASPTTAPATRTPKTVPTKAKPAYDLRAVQARLRELNYYLGEPDGEPGGRTRSAVQAFQKVNGLSADGVIGPKTLAALSQPTTPTLRGGIGNRLEIDLTKQVMYVVKNDVIQRILPVSTGSGDTYFQKDGDRATSLTPTGFFRIERRIVGVREADLGVLYDPQYFYRGWAIHGSNFVPPYPASHGCVRITRTDATWLLAAIEVGIGVYLYGGQHTFEAGSPAPGTDTPTGDRPPAPTARPTPAPAPEGSATPAPAPGTPTPTPSTPIPSTPTASAPPAPTPTSTAPADRPPPTATPPASAPFAPFGPLGP